MPTLVPVDYDPFAPQAAAPKQPTFTPVDYDPFAPRLGMTGDSSDPGDISPLTTGGTGPDGRLVDQMNAAGFARGADAAVGAVARGIPFSDRIAALGSALTGIGGHFGDYSGALADMRAIDVKQAAANPQGELVGNLVGGGLATAAATPAGIAAALGRAGLGGRIAAGALGGGAFGAAQGASDAPDLTNLPDTFKRASQGAETGAAIGGIAPSASAVASRAYQLGATLLGDVPSGATRAGNAMAEALLTPKVADAVAKFGPDATLPDASPAALGLAQGVVAKPGPWQDPLVDALNKRNAAQSDRLLADRNAALGPAISPQQMAAALDKSATVSPLLEQAYAKNPAALWNPELAAVADRPAVVKALRTASDTAANSGNPLPTIITDEAGQQVTPAARTAFDAYQADAVPRTQNALADLLGSGGQLGTQDAVTARRAAAAAPLYDQFRASDIQMTDDIQELLKAPSIRAALPNAERLAQDEGKSIYQTTPGVADEPTPQGQGRPFAPIEAYEEAQNAAPIRPDIPRPQTLQDFVKSLGGVQDPKGDLQSMGLTSVPGLVAKPGKGLGPDAVRQAAAEAGYLGPHIDDAMSNTTVNDLYDALGSHPVHSVYDQDAAQRWSSFDQLKAESGGLPPRNGRSAAPPFAPRGGGPDVAPARQITPEGWDYVKRAIGDQIETAQRSGARNEARVYTGLKSRLTDALDDAAPVYAQARQVYAGHSALLDALEAGGKSMAPGVTREQVEREFAALGTDGEREMYRLGAGNSLRDMVAKKGDDVDLARSIRGNLAMRSKLATVAPSPEALQRFNGTLDAQSKAFDEASRPDVRGWRLSRDALRAQQASATGDQATAIGMSADAIDAQLQAIPEVMRADLAEHTARAAQAAFDRGRTVLRSGDDQPWPADLAKSFDAMPLEQQAALRAGARSDIEQRFGQNRNDMAALARMLGDTNDTNRAHMGTLFGDPAVQHMADALNREQNFAATRNAVTQGSRTAPMQAGKEAIDAAAKPREFIFPKEGSTLGLATHAGEYLVRKAAGALASRSSEATRNYMAQVLSMSGPDLEAFLGRSGAQTRAANVQALARALGALQPFVAPAPVDARRGRQAASQP